MSRRRSSSRVAACAAATTPALSPQRSKPAGAAPELRKSRPERDELQDKNMPNNSFGESSCTAAASGLVQVRGARENNHKEVDVTIDRKSAVLGHSVSVRDDYGGRRITKKKRAT